MHPLPTLFAVSKEEEEGKTERKRNWVGLSLPFLLVTSYHVQPQWLVNMGKCHEEGYGRLLWLLMCFCCSRYSASDANSGSDWKRGLSGLSAPRLLSPRCHMLTWFSLCPAELPSILGPLEFCAHGAFWMLYVNRAAKKWGYTHCTYFLCSWHAPLSHWIYLKAQFQK